MLIRARSGILPLAVKHYRQTLESISKRMKEQKATGGEVSPARGSTSSSFNQNPSRAAQDSRHSPRDSIQSADYLPDDRSSRSLPRSNRPMAGGIETALFSSDRIARGSSHDIATYVSVERPCLRCIPLPFIYCSKAKAAVLLNL